MCCSAQLVQMLVGACCVFTAEQVRSLPADSTAPAFEHVHLYRTRTSRCLCRWRTTSTAENVTQALLAQHPRRSVHLDHILREHYTRDANYYIHTDPWYTTRWLLDVLGSLSIWIGALLYNVSCFAGAWQAWRCTLE